MALYRKLGVRIGQNSTILMLAEMHFARQIRIGQNSVINPHCYLDGRGGLDIGSNVNISQNVLLVAGSHDYRDGQKFAGSAVPIKIEDYAWLCARCTVLPGVVIGRGAVIAAGAVVTKSVEAHAIMAGVPAKKIGERTDDLTYELVYDVDWQ